MTKESRPWLYIEGEPNTTVDVAIALDDGGSLTFGVSVDGELRMMIINLQSGQIELPTEVPVSAIYLKDETNA